MKKKINTQLMLVINYLQMCISCNTQIGGKQIFYSVLVMIIAWLIYWQIIFVHLPSFVKTSIYCMFLVVSYDKA